MTSFTTRMPSGFAGQITRDPQAAIVEAEMLGATVPTAFGLPIKTTAGLLVPIATSDAATVVTGVLVRAYPNQSVTNVAGSDAPVASTLANRMRKGYVLVKCAYGTAALDGAVYMRSIITGSTRNAGTAGDFEALSDTGVSNANVVLSGYRWMGAADASGLAELAVNM